MSKGCFDLDWSSAEVGAKTQIVPDHDAVLCPSKCPSCSIQVHGEFPCAW